MLIDWLDTDSRIAPAPAADLDESLAPHEDRVFDDGEHKWRPLTDPCGDDAYVVASRHGDAQASPHDKLCRLLMFVATLRDHRAGRFTAVVPYLACARKDRRTKPFDPLAARRWSWPRPIPVASSALSCGVNRSKRGWRDQWVARGSTSGAAVAW